MAKGDILATKRMPLHTAQGFPLIVDLSLVEGKQVTVDCVIKWEMGSIDHEDRRSFGERGDIEVPTLINDWLLEIGNQIGTQIPRLDEWNEGEAGSLKPLNEILENA